MSTKTNSEKEPLQEIIAAYLEACATGKDSDQVQAQLLAAHPDLAVDLRDFFAVHVPMTKAAGLLRDHLSDSPAAATDFFPQPFGDYELLEEIGRGGMGVVYKARQISLNRIVALKRIRAGQLASPEEVARFRREAEAAAGLDHPHIVPILEVGEHAGQHFFTMKLIEGGNLNAHLARFADAKATAELMIQIARAVHHAHQRGILHRDLKPGNILIDAAGQPHVSDFGLAQPIEKEAKLTQSGAILGTPEFMAPEQARGEKGLTTAADVYGLGAILYVLLTGRPPFQGDYNWETLKKVVEDEPVSPRSLQRKVNRDLEAICLHCLVKLATRRYGTAEALADDLQRWLDGKPIIPRRAGVVTRLGKWVKRRPARAALIVATAMLLLIGPFAYLQWRDLQVQNNLAANRQTALAASEKLAREREWFLLLNQARADRLAGRRDQALGHLKKLAGLSQAAPDVGDPTLLHEEAFLAINVPGATLLREMAFGRLADPEGRSTALAPSPDGKHLLVRGAKFGSKVALEVWSVPLGKGDPVLYQPIKNQDGQQPEAGRKEWIGTWTGDSKYVRFGTRLWDPVANTYHQAVDAEGQPLKDDEAQPLFSPQGRWQALGNQYWKAGAEKNKQPLPGRAVRFLSETRLLAEKRRDNDNDFLHGLIVWNLDQEKIDSDWSCTVWEAITAQRIVFWTDRTIEVCDLVEDAQGQWAPVQKSYPLLARKGHLLLTLEKGEKDAPLLRLRDLKSDLVLNSATDHPDAASNLGNGKLLGDGRWLVNILPTNDDRVRSPARAFNLSSGENYLIGGRTKGNAVVGFAPLSGLFLTGDRRPDESNDSRTLRLWDLETQHNVLTLDNPDIQFSNGHAITSNYARPWPVWSDSGQILAAPCRVQPKPGGWAEGWRAWRVTYPNPSFLGAAVNRLEFSPDGHWLAMNNELWKVTRGGDLAFLQPALRQEQTKANYDPYGSSTGGNEGKLWKDAPSPLLLFGKEGKIWNVHAPTKTKGIRIQALHDAGKEIELPALDLKAPYHIIAISPKGKYAVVAHDWLFKVWDLSGPTPTVAWFHQFEAVFTQGRGRMPFRPIFVSEDSFHIVERNGGAFFHIPSRRREGGDELWWNRTNHSFPLSAGILKIEYEQVYFTDGRPRVRLQGAESNPSTPWFPSPDDRLLARTRDNQRVEVWDVATGELLLRWQAHDETITALAFSPDGQLLATGDARGVKLWNLGFILNEREGLGLARTWPRKKVGT